MFQCHASYVRMLLFHGQLFDGRLKIARYINEIKNQKHRSVITEAFTASVMTASVMTNV